MTDPAAPTMIHAIAVPPLPTLPIEGEHARFPVGRIFCVGRNYADHAREMGADPVRELPFFFTKAPSALLTDGADLDYPPMTANLHHEVEMVVAIATGGSHIAPVDVASHIFGHAVGIDFTRRDRQDEAKAARRPWDMSKSFDGAAPVGALVRGALPLPDERGIALSVDGTVRQSARLGDMIWNEAELIAELSRWQPLAAGDLIFTGTPAGVAAVAAGARLLAEVDGLPPLAFAICG